MVDERNPQPMRPEQQPQQYYKGKPVDVRPAKQGDVGFNTTAGPQVVVTDEDGKEQVVLAKDVSATK